MPQQTRPPGRLVELSTVERADRAIKKAGFRPLAIADDRVRRIGQPGFVLRPCQDDRVEVRWSGLRDLGGWHRRRTCLTGYAGVLRQAGLAVWCVADENEAYLVCRAARCVGRLGEARSA